ncbi:MAG: aldehyde dehydrogenase family protein [Myxococcales bacterium]|nr:aldehyde dehydrogenase family protein [Myxococcales bacterium]|tara:strand:- start:471 stop:1949 length:1479 start_codon:yes stop_codon:yes gene_type:complete
MASVYKNYIDGEWVESQATETIPNINPASFAHSWGEVPLSTAAEATQAIDAAEKAFDEWRKVPAPKRGEIVLNAWKIMEGRVDEIARHLSREEGKIFKEARGELMKTLNCLEYLGGEGRRLSGVSRESELPRNYAYTRREPLGVVGLITPWNFPVAIPAWKIAPALVAGNTIVLKPSELTPQTACDVVQCFIDAGVPKGVLNMVHGLGEVVGHTIVKDHRVSAISFTGSNEVGHLIYAEGAERGARVQCEMGGKNPIIVLADANLPLAAEATAQGAFGSTGQRCTATSRAIVHEDVADEFVAMLTEKMKGIVAGDPLDPETTMGPSVDRNQFERVLDYLTVGKDEATQVMGGQRMTENGLDGGYFIEPTLFDHVSPTARIAQEEIFGPVLSVIRVKSFEEAIEVANNVKYGLSSSLYTNDYACVFEYIDRIETGICHVNSPTMGGEAHMPFGGMKSTGIGGREMNEEAMEFFTELKTVYFDYTGAGRTSSMY